MKIFTKKQLEQLIINGTGENRGKDHKPVVKLYVTMTRWAWLLTELDEDRPNIAFGLCDVGDGFPKLGCVALDELAKLRDLDKLRIVGNDELFEAKFPISVYARAASFHKHFVESNDILIKFVK